MKYIIKIDGYLEIPAIQEICASDVIELQDKSSELSQLSVLDFGDDFLIQGSVYGINIDSEYSIHAESETGVSILWEGNFPIEIHPITLDFIPSHFYRYELRIADGCLSFEVECEALDQDKLILRVSELLFPRNEEFPEGKLRIITGLNYAGEVIEPDEELDYCDVYDGIFTVNECGELILTNTEKTTSNTPDCDQHI